MKDRIFSGKNLASFIAFLYGFQAACNDCKMHDGAATCLFKHYLTSPVEAVVMGRAALSTGTAKSRKRFFPSFLAVVRNILNRSATDDNKATKAADIRNFKQSRQTAPDYAEQLRIKTLRLGSVSREKTMNGLILGSVHRLLCRTPRQWQSEHQRALLEGLSHHSNSYTDL